jgi:3-hydroxyacyl-[acyl-carrier-protein] dehydratase
MTAVEEGTRVYVDPDDPVFAGHYPGFPILPGLFVVEHVHAAVRDRLPGKRVSAVQRAKFLRPVFPGDILSITAELVDDDHGVLVAAVVSTGDGPVAEIKLRYSS